MQLKSIVAVIVLVLGLASANVASADMIKVLYPQGAARGFVEVTTLDGHRIALGDLVQTKRRETIISRLTMRFDDGSLDDDTTVYTQGEVFRLLSDHHVQRGPSFPHASDTLVDTRAATVSMVDEHGNRVSKHFKMPADTYNGMASTMVMNVNALTTETSIAIVVPISSPRLAHIQLKRAGRVDFKIGDREMNGQDFVLHVDLGFVAGLVAPLLGDTPADYHVITSEGPVPAFIRMEGQFYLGGPIWRIQQISAAFPASGPSRP